MFGDFHICEVRRLINKLKFERKKNPQNSVRRKILRRGALLRSAERVRSLCLLVLSVQDRFPRSPRQTDEILRRIRSVRRILPASICRHLFREYLFASLRHRTLKVLFRTRRKRLRRSRPRRKRLLKRLLIEIESVLATLCLPDNLRQKRLRVLPI